MAEKFNTLTLKLGDREQTKDIVLKGDPNNPDVEIPVRFKRLSVVDTLSMPQDTDDIVKDYVTGRISTKIDPVSKEAAQFQSPPLPIPPLDGQVVTISKGTASMIAILMAAQAGGEQQRFYVTDWAHILTVPTFAQQLVRVVNGFVTEDLNDESWLYEEADSENPLADSDGTGQGSSTSASKSSEPIPQP